VSPPVTHDGTPQGQFRPDGGVKQQVREGSLKSWPYHAHLPLPSSLFFFLFLFDRLLSYARMRPSLLYLFFAILAFPNT
jgi:hypothetical protein